MNRRALLLCLLAAGCLYPARAQVIEFESNGLKYQTLTNSGLTIMFAHLPLQVREYAILQVAVSNGSNTAWSVQPENLFYKRADGSTLPASSARVVVGHLIEKGGRNDVVKMVSAYESSLYGISRIRSTNGYEQRRQAALAEVSSTRLKAAAAASAIALVNTRLTPGQSTDGAVFFSTEGKPLTGGRVVARVGSLVFEFNPE
jgi:hypothetical protein